ncbi:MAG: phosphotransferase, partial [Verrucomicrobiota bacterium]|nr:phosphotransferase [Verrucomicrobiota bacterium]
YGTAREENRHYVAIARFLGTLGVRVPEIYFHDEAEQLIWMEDLGDCDLWSFRGAEWPARRRLYEATLDEAARLHRCAPDSCAREMPRFQSSFDAPLYRWEQNYFLENCLVRHFGLEAGEVEHSCDRLRLHQIAEELAARPRCLVHRDFQSQNVVIKDDEICLIDFQGMRPGLSQYDLASLLYDPYVRLTPAERRELMAYYVGAREDEGPGLPPDFEHVFLLCAAQRLMQALGAYGFLGHVRERADFLTHIPAAITSLSEVLAQIEGVDRLRELIRDCRRS